MLITVHDMLTGKTLKSGHLSDDAGNYQAERLAERMARTTTFSYDDMYGVVHCKLDYTVAERKFNITEV
tara:strand:+ start:572 stop:778 length:207 start_codon:yes stop_codon:yes gene_type:complete